MEYDKLFYLGIPTQLPKSLLKRSTLINNYLSRCINRGLFASVFPGNHTGFCSPAFSWRNISGLPLWSGEGRHGIHLQIPSCSFWDSQYDSSGNLSLCILKRYGTFLSGLIQRSLLYNVRWLQCLRLQIWVRSQELAWKQNRCHRKEIISFQ